MLKYWRLMILIVCVLGSLLAIGFKLYPYVSTAEIIYVAPDSPASGILETGMIITEFNGEKISNQEDWENRIQGLTGTVNIMANGQSFILIINETLGIDVRDVEKTNMDFGLDIKGGTRIIMKPKENATKDMIDQVIGTLQTRANVYGLKEMRFFSLMDLEGNYYIQIEAAGISKNIIDDLLSRQGKFEAKVSKPVALENNEGSIQLGDKTYAVTLSSNNDIEIESVGTVEPSDNFVLKNIDFQYINATDNQLLLLATTYTGKDIELVYSDAQKSGVKPVGNGYSFYFTILVSAEGAQRFADVTTGIPKHIDLQIGEEYLDSQIFLFLDGEAVSQLNIGADLGGRIYNTPQIQGSRETAEEASQEKLSMQTILRSGALPTTLETSSIDVISPTLGTNFFQNAAIAAIFGSIAIVVITFVRYRRIKISVPLALIGLSEVIIILGVAATNDYYIWGLVMLINVSIATIAWWKKEDLDIYAWGGAILIPILGMMSWTIDLPAIGGIIAAIGTGVDHQIIIADETIAGKKEENEHELFYDVKDRIRRAFFIIFGAAATTIAAMVPLMAFGIGLVRGFAITTIVGVLIGILVTRPAYAKIIERMVKK